MFGRCVSLCLFIKWFSVVKIVVGPRLKLFETSGFERNSAELLPEPTFDGSSSKAAAEIDQITTGYQF